jgi:hypothetical protein
MVEAAFSPHRQDATDALQAAQDGYVHGELRG